MKAEKTLLELWCDEIDTPDLDDEGKLQVAEARKQLAELERLAEIGRATERTAEFRNVHLSYEGDDDDTWECSECKQAWIIDGNPKEHHYHFCPNCGAKFQEGDNA